MIGVQVVEHVGEDVEYQSHDRGTYLNPHNVERVVTHWKATSGEARVLASELQENDTPNIVEVRQ